MSIFKKAFVAMMTIATIFASSAQAEDAFFKERTFEGRVYTLVFGKLFEVTDHQKLLPQQKRVYEACLIMHSDVAAEATDGDVILVNHISPSAPWFSQRLLNVGEKQITNKEKVVRSILC